MNNDELRRAIEQNLDGDLLNIFREYYQTIPNAVQDGRKFILYWKAVQMLKKLDGNIDYDDLNRPIALHIINLQTDDILHLEDQSAHELGEIISWFDCVDMSAHGETLTLQLGMEIYS